MGSKYCNTNGSQVKLYWKMNLICSHSMRVSWSVYELFSWPLCIYIYIYIYQVHGSDITGYLTDIYPEHLYVRKWRHESQGEKWNFILWREKHANWNIKVCNIHPIRFQKEMKGLWEKVSFLTFSGTSLFSMVPGNPSDYSDRTPSNFSPLRVMAKGDWLNAIHNYIIN